MPTILYADDEPSFRSLFEIWLRGGGFDVRLASDGLEALNSLADHGLPDAILLDVRMPRLDGIELCRILRRVWPLLPIVLVSADERLETIGRNAGASAVLPKPSSSRELCRLFNRLIAAPATSVHAA
jgi:two-component system, OmpR family, alkaline phosphatase synthesis response regulator PhoP